MCGERSVPWDEIPNQLVSGDLSRLDPPIADLIKRAAAMPEAIDLARQFNMSPLILIFAILGLHCAS